MRNINRSKEGHNNIPLSQTGTGSIFYVHVIKIFEVNFELASQQQQAQGLWILLQAQKLSGASSVYTYPKPC